MDLPHPLGPAKRVSGPSGNPARRCPANADNRNSVRHGRNGPSRTSTDGTEGAVETDNGEDADLGAGTGASVPTSPTHGTGREESAEAAFTSAADAGASGPPDSGDAEDNGVCGP
ncbi:hypothetical protein GCM10010121_037600 [Streptomyces brasiliensis]|uniref:Uncharacterized protein n=1 Tax=Streptomyces brasiliensis TaxID=1954 RepID=A0A917NS11_9ACTN|nr:hypothetical protein GCM10010121_037600 [Streptomyces brasiliensis]